MSFTKFSLLTIDSKFQVGETGKVVGIDHIDELINWSKDNVRKDNPALLESGRIKFVVGDGRKGFPADAPYNAIHVGAAAPTLPQEVRFFYKIILLTPEDYKHNN